MNELIEDLERDIREGADYVSSIRRPNVLISSLKDLNNMIGNVDLKNDIARQVDYLIDSKNDVEDKDPIMLHTLLYGGPGTGKCLSKDTLVMMYDGSTHVVQDIIKGDLLMGDDSEPRKVLSTTTGTEMMYKVKQLYGDDYTVNESHIISLKLSVSPIITDLSDKRSFIVEWFEKEGIGLKTFSYENEDKENVRLILKDFLNRLPEKDSIIDIEIKDYIKRSREWKIAFGGYKVGVDYPKKEVWTDPYEFGMLIRNLVLNYSEDVISHFDSKYIPDEYLFNTREVRLELLAGLIDTDSHRDSKNDTFSVIQKNIILANNIMFLSRSLGFKSYISKYKGETDLYNIIYITGDIGIIPSRLDEGKIQSKEVEKNNLVYDIEVIPQEIGQYYGFEIDGNHRFLLGDFTVTHNTTVGKHLGRIWYSLGYIGQNKGSKKDYRSSTDTKEKKSSGDITDMINGLLSDNMEEFQNSYLKLVVLGIIISMLAVVWGYVWSVLKASYNLLGLKWLMILLAVIITVLIVIFLYYIISTVDKCAKCNKDKCICLELRKTHQIKEQETLSVEASVQENIRDEDLIDIVSAEDFIGQYVGWTEKKTTELLQKSKGKVLFIDEAYSLISSSGMGDSFGEKSLNIINRHMSENPDGVIIMAGYEDKIKNNLFKTQPGLARRFMWSFDCKGYDVKELFEIWKQQLKPRTLADEQKVLEIFRKNKNSFPNFAGDTLRLVNFVKLEQKSDTRRRRAPSSDLSSVSSVYDAITPNQVDRAIKVLSRNSINNGPSRQEQTMTPEMLRLLSSLSGNKFPS